MYFSKLEYLKDFSPNRDFRAFFEDFHIIKSAQATKISGFGLYKYIDEEKI